MSIEAAAIIVPVHDEAQLLADGLAAIAVARARLAVPSVLVVVLDACTDASAAIARRLLAPGDIVLAVEARSVGVARRAGVAAALGALSQPRERIWLATTDADSIVSPYWLEAHLAEDAAAVCGAVRIEDWGGYPPARALSYERFYASVDGHVHGANFGVRAGAYLAVGGFPAVKTGEDVALHAALVARDFDVRVTRGHPVTTSSRPAAEARAPDGFAAFLEAWDLAS